MPTKDRFSLSAWVEESIRDFAKSPANNLGGTHDEPAFDVPLVGFSGGDDPLYVGDMIAWMRNPANHVLYEAYFDYDGRGTNSAITDGRFPNSLAAFRTGFKRTDVRTAAVRTEAGGVNAVWFILAAVVITGGMGLYWRRRVRGNARIDWASRRISPPAEDIVGTPVREWAEQTRC